MMVLGGLMMGLALLALGGAVATPLALLVLLARRPHDK